MSPTKPVIDDFEQPAPQGPDLLKHIRLPGLHVKLPSKGRFMPPGSVKLTATGEVPVIAMRAYDEMLMKTPDALLNGYAIEKLIESCVPDVKNVKALSSPDIDVLLLAIRAATFGTKMPVQATCPKCGFENAFDDMDLQPILDSVGELDEQITERLSPEIEVHLRPYNYENATQASLLAYQETRNIKEAESRGEDERNKIINHSIERLNELNLTLAAECVIAVATPDGVATDRQQIGEFVRQMPAPWFRRIENRLKAINKQGIDKRQAVACIQCHHEWQTEVEFDPAGFFGPSS